MIHRISGAFSYLVESIAALFSCFSAAGPPNASPGDARPPLKSPATMLSWPGLWPLVWA